MQNCAEYMQVRHHIARTQHIRSPGRTCCRHPSPHALGPDPRRTRPTLTDVSCLPRSTTSTYVPCFSRYRQIRQTFLALGPPPPPKTPQDETNRGRDVSLCHRVGVLDTGSLVAVAGMVAPPAQHTPPVPGHTTAPGSAAGGPASIVSPVAPIPLLCAYLTSREPLPESLLEAALAAVHQAFKVRHVVRLL